MSVASSPAMLANDRLAKQLMECAMLVKRGDKTSPLLHETILGLTDYLTAKTAAAATAKPSRPVTPGPSQAAQQQRPPVDPRATPIINNTVAASSTPAAAGGTTVGQPVRPALGEVIGKMIGVQHEFPDILGKGSSEEQKAATSQKNAQRVKGDLASLLKTGEDEWCEEHFCRGCACKRRPVSGSASVSSASTTHTSTPMATPTAVPATANPVRIVSKPPFARPVNPASPLIANGWIEQQRRSKMRTVWKDVLASLVEGRKPGEETTLWIQREVTDPISGKVILEALHQIPVKWLEEINYLQYSSDNRFSLKVYNLHDEFVFRTNKDDEAAQNWVLTLRSVKQIAQRAKQNPQRPIPNETYINSSSSAGSVDSSQQEEKKADHQSTGYHRQPPQPQHHRMTVTELRAIAHGAGIQTVGMERGELEAVVIRIAQNGAGARQHPTAPPPPPATAPPPPAAAPPPPAAAPFDEDVKENPAERQLRLEEMRRTQQAEEEAAARRRLEEEQLRKQQEQKMTEEEKERARLIAEKVHQQQVAEKLRRDEEERVRLAEERRKRDDEEIRRKLAEKQAAEDRRKQEEAARLQQQQWQQQQQQWQQQQAEERRRQEEAYRAAAYQQQQAQWQHQQQRPTQPPMPQQPPPQQAPPRQPSYNTQQQQQWQQQQQQRPPYGPAPTPPPPHQQQYPHPQQQQQWQQQQQRPQQPQSAINQKYAKMAQVQEKDTMTQIKHGILIQWALQPPMLQVLRPVDELILTVHKVFPPALGVPAHEYFSKWAPLTVNDVSQGPAFGNRPDEAKLKKALRKLRFFLHPDKLPRELSKEQTFVCKMLWDVVNDAEEEFKKKEEDLGWIRG